VGFFVTTPCCHISEEQAYVSQVGKVLSCIKSKQHKCYNFKVEEYKNDRSNHNNLIYKKKFHKDTLIKFITEHNKEKNKAQYPRLLRVNKPYSLGHHILSLFLKHMMVERSTKSLCLHHQVLSLYL